MNSGRALTRHIENDELCQDYIPSDNYCGQKPERLTIKQQLFERGQHGVMCGMRQVVGAYATCLNDHQGYTTLYRVIASETKRGERGCFKGGYTLESAISSDLIQPRFLSREERANIAIQKRAQEIRQQKDKEDQSRSQREQLERQAEEI